MEISTVLQAIIAALGAVLTYFVVPWLREKTGEAKWATISTTAQHAIRAAEQLFDSGQGETKKQYVIDYLAGKGITLDDTIVEGLVNSLFGKSGTTTTAPEPETVSSEFTEVE